MNNEESMYLAANVYATGLFLIKYEAFFNDLDTFIQQYSKNPKTFKDIMINAANIYNKMAEVCFSNDCCVQLNNHGSIQEINLKVMDIQEFNDLNDELRACIKQAYLNLNNDLDTYVQNLDKCFASIYKYATGLFSQIKTICDQQEKDLNTLKNNNIKFNHVISSNYRSIINETAYILD